MTEEEEECWSEPGWPRLSDAFLLKAAPELLQSAPHCMHRFLPFTLSIHPKIRLTVLFRENITEYNRPEQAAFYTHDNHCSLMSYVN